MKPTILPRKLWKPSQRVWWVYQSYDKGPIASTGTVEPYDSPSSRSGIMIKPDNPLIDSFFVWDFVIRGGTGRTSPFYQLSLL